MIIVKIAESTALVTGGDRGVGRSFAMELVSRGAARVYGAGRHPAALTEPGVTPIALDITDPQRVAAAARESVPRDHELIYAPLLQQFFDSPG